MRYSSRKKRRDFSKETKEVSKSQEQTKKRSSMETENRRIILRMILKESHKNDLVFFIDFKKIENFWLFQTVFYNFDQMIWIRNISCNEESIHIGSLGGEGSQRNVMVFVDGP